MKLCFLRCDLKRNGDLRKMETSSAMIIVGLWKITETEEMGPHIKIFETITWRTTLKFERMFRGGFP